MTKDYVLVGPLKIPSQIHLKEFESHPHIFIDGGITHRDSVLGPHFFSLGDGDSGSASQLDYLHPKDKDRSDFALSLKQLFLSTGDAPLNLHLIGLWAERLDHFLALLGESFEALKKTTDLKLYLYDEHFNIRAILFKDELKWSHQGIFSLFSLTKVDVTIEGKAHFNGDFVLPPLSSQGLSNEANGELSIKSDGPLLLWLNH